MKKRSGCLHRIAGVVVGVVVWLVLEQGLGFSSVFSWLIACITAIVLWLVLEGRAERKSGWMNLNRIYNLYLARDFREMRSGPCTQIILCDVHAERFKKIVKKDPGTHMFRSKARKKGITPLPCAWCDEPEEFEDMEAEHIKRR
ncbi:hypothetical protein ES703_108400 [subsurface metagenome]